ncbi:MAG TPA: hypothetical protein DCS66_09700 [Flavobacteriaceae bacterium]|nr:hypothetical protein [Flavobacteriaceae bacterium]|tara:strand:+ start:579 stop:1025 length:447 start_codon:yes stop_codon:yes gene_type:complete
MMKKLFIYFFVLISTLSYSQEHELNKLFSERLNKGNLEARVNRLVLSTYQYNEGDVIRISVKFELNEEGRLKNILVRAPIPQIEEIITNELKSVEIPEDILASMNLEKTFAFPILFQVKSEAEMRKIIAKEKKEKEKEERKKNKKKKN